VEPIAAVFACNCDLVFVFASGSSRAYYTCKYVAKPVVSIDHQVAIDIAGKAVAHAIARRQQRLPEARGELASALSVLMSAVMHQAGNTVELPATMCWWHVLYGATGVHSRRRIAKIHLPAIAEFLAESQSAIPTIVRNEAEQKPTITQYHQDYFFRAAELEQESLYGIRRNFATKTKRFRIPAQPNDAVVQRQQESDDENSDDAPRFVNEEDDEYQRNSGDEVMDEDDEQQQQQQQQRQQQQQPPPPPPPPQLQGEVDEEAPNPEHAQNPMENERESRGLAAIVMRTEALHARRRIRPPPSPVGFVVSEEREYRFHAEHSRHGTAVLVPLEDARTLVQTVGPRLPLASLVYDIRPHAQLSREETLRRDEARRVYAFVLLVMFRPWRTLHDLLRGHDTFWAALCEAEHVQDPAICAGHGANYRIHSEDYYARQSTSAEQLRRRREAMRQYEQEVRADFGNERHDGDAAAAYVDDPANRVDRMIVAAQMSRHESQAVLDEARESALRSFIAQETIAEHGRRNERDTRRLKEIRQHSPDVVSALSSIYADDARVAAARHAAGAADAAVNANAEAAMPHAHADVGVPLHIGELPFGVNFLREQDITALRSRIDAAAHAADEHAILDEDQDDAVFAAAAAAENAHDAPRIAAAPLIDRPQADSTIVELQQLQRGEYMGRRPDTSAIADRFSLNAEQRTALARITRGIVETEIGEFSPYYTQCSSLLLT